MVLEREDILIGRKLEIYNQHSKEEWGYTVPQIDIVAVLYPKDYDENTEYPLYVVFPSAGHTSLTALDCLKTKGNHDIYHVPDDMFGLFVDCRYNMENQFHDWCWGGLKGHGDFNDMTLRGTNKNPVENRCIATVLWAMEKYPINETRVYACGNSLGGTGCLGVAGCRGDIFAAVKSNVPAGVFHIVDRCALLDESPKGVKLPPKPENFKIPDMPIILDYSSPVDYYSMYHECLFDGMREKKYALLSFWGAFGHENNHEKIAEYNDLVEAFDIFSVKKNEAYPAFTNASTDDVSPWPDNRESEESGQINAFFRWEVLSDEENEFKINLRLLNPQEWKTRVELPTESVADVTLRRLQKFKIKEGQKIKWEYDGNSGEITCDDGVFTLERIKVTQNGSVLKLSM